MLCFSSRIKDAMKLRALQLARRIFLKRRIFFKKIAGIYTLSCGINFFNFPTCIVVNIIVDEKSN